MKKIVALLGLAAAVLPAVQAQSFQRNQVTGMLGFASPREDLKPYYQTAFAWSFMYGYRPLRYLQLNAGYDGAYNAANVNYYVNSGFGPLRVRDFQVFVPMGASAVLPLAGGRVEVIGGGGGAYMRYTEILQQPDPYYHIGCPYCSARDGWGYHAQVGANVALDRAQHLRLGWMTRMYSGNTSGPTIGTTPAVNTRDRWLNTYFGLAFSF